LQVTKRANNTPYGLAAGVMSKNVDTVNMLSRNLQAGTVWVNCYNTFDPSMPFGGKYALWGIGSPSSPSWQGRANPYILCLTAGYKESGIGRDGGSYAISHYTRVKSIYQAMPAATNWM
jgi:aldehyde dehydrogenase (NAD+)